jgi:hypothetical protein
VGLVSRGHKLNGPRRKKFLERWLGELRRLLRKNGRAETPEAKLRRLGRSSAESEAVHPTIQQAIIDRAQADLMIKRNNLCQISLLNMDDR